MQLKEIIYYWKILEKFEANTTSKRLAKDFVLFLPETLVKYLFMRFLCACRT